MKLSTLFFLSLCTVFLVKNSMAQNETLKREYVSAQKIILSEGNVKNATNLLREGIGQATLNNQDVCVLSGKCSILLDFGCEMHGGVQIVTGMSPVQKPIQIHLTFGESVSEAMSTLGEKGATNDHAMRDFTVSVPWLGVLETGNTGYRFLRIELADTTSTLHLREVRGISITSSYPLLGSFSCSDSTITKIWQVGAKTVHLCMQDYLWDGIKRDRLVWVGDMFPEMMTILSTYGAVKIVPKSLDLSRDSTPLPQWINGISSYSLWWILLHDKWHQYTGDISYLKEQKEYLFPLLRQIIDHIDQNGHEQLGGTRFLDWPSNANTMAVNAGLQALCAMTLNSGERLCHILGEEPLAKECKEMHSKTLSYTKKMTISFKKKNRNQIGEKQAIALLSLCGAMDSNKATSFLEKEGANGFSTFYGYFMIEALAKDGHYSQAMDIIKKYWGGMIKMGSTTFWEDFDLNWTENASPIDELVQDGKKDIHGDFGAYCYKGFRHSLCHGWASGPTAWLSHHVLGIEIIDEGFKSIRISPNIGSLLWAEGTFGTPYGNIYIRCEKDSTGKTSFTVKSPDEIKIIN